MSNSPSLHGGALIRYALQLRDADNPEAAIPLLQKALADDPRNATVWQTLGLIHRACDDSGDAIACLSKALQLAPNDGRIAHGLARVTLEAGLPALDLFGAAARLAPSDGDVLIGRSAAQLALGQSGQAMVDLAAGLADNPLWLEGHAALSNLHWLVGDEVGFVASYASAIAANPKNLPLWLALIDRYIRVDRYDWALAGLGAARKVLGDTADLDAFTAICASETGDLVMADRLFAAIGTRRNIALAVRHVRHLLRSGKVAEAIAVGEGFVDDPDANQIWPYLATAWRLVGDPRWQWLEGQSCLIGAYKICDEPAVERLAYSLRQVHKGSYPPPGQSVRHGTQTDGPLFSRIEPEIVALRDKIRTAVSDHAGNFGEADLSHPTLRHQPGSVRFAGSWSVRLTGSGFHTNHVHPQGWISSAFYAAVPDAAEAGDAPAGHIAFGVPPHELGLDLPPIRTIKPEPGTLILFPSTMWHGTLPIIGGERLTVAFDVKAPPLAVATRRC